MDCGEGAYSTTVGYCLKDRHGVKHDSNSMDRDVFSGAVSGSPLGAEILGGWAMLTQLAEGASERD